MKIFIAGGGTGGHVYPAVAIANELKYRHADWEIEFVGRSDSIEGRVAKQEGYLLHNIDVIGYERFLGKIEKTRVILKLCKSMFESMSLIRKHKPDMVIGTGGYVCGPIVYVAALKKMCIRDRVYRHISKNAGFRYLKWLIYLFSIKNCLLYTSRCV